MKCNGCSYDMSATPDADRCPECGALDWRTRLKSRWLRRLAIATAGLPWVWLVMVHSLHVVAAIELGHWPKFDSDMVSSAPITQVLGTLLILVAIPILYLGLPSVGIVLMIACGRAVIGWQSWRHALHKIAILGLPWAAFLLWFCVIEADSRFLTWMMAWFD